MRSICTTHFRRFNPFPKVFLNINPHLLQGKFDLRTCIDIRIDPKLDHQINRWLANLFQCLSTPQRYVHLFALQPFEQCRNRIGTHLYQCSMSSRRDPEVGIRQCFNQVRCHRRIVLFPEASCGLCSFLGIVILQFSKQCTDFLFADKVSMRIIRGISRQRTTGEQKRSRQQQQAQ